MIIYENLNAFENKNTYNVFKGINSKNINKSYNGNDDGIGDFYTDNFLMAEWFAGIKEFKNDKYVLNKDHNGVVINKKIKLNNPYVINSSDEDNDSFQIYMNEIDKFKDVLTYKKHLIDKKYDGIILNNCNTNYYIDNSSYNIYIVF